MTKSTAQVIIDNDSGDEVTLDTVDRATGTRPFYSLGQDAEFYQSGSISYRDYEKDTKLRVITYQDLEGKEFTLGRTSGGFRILDHKRVLTPLFDAGWVPTKIHPSKGGSGLWVNLVQPEITFPNNITWDNGFLGGIPELSALDGNDGMNLAIAVQLDPRPGQSIMLTAGFFRLICLNGMVARILDMGFMKLNHLHFTPEKIASFSAGLITEESQDLQRQLVLPHVPNAALDWPIEILQQKVYGAADETDRVVAGLPSFVQKPVKQLTDRLPNWASEALVDQLLAAKEEAEFLSPMDTLNALTNIANTAPGRSHTRLYGQMDRWNGALWTMLLAAAFKASVPVEDRPVFAG